MWSSRKLNYTIPCFASWDLHSTVQWEQTVCTPRFLFCILSLPGQILKLHSTRTPPVKFDSTRKTIPNPLNSFIFVCQINTARIPPSSGLFLTAEKQDTPQKHEGFYSETGLYLLKNHFSLPKTVKIYNWNRWCFCKKNCTP